MADPVQLIPAGGRTGETLLILGILGAGAFLLWRRGLFDKPGPVVRDGAGSQAFRHEMSARRQADRMTGGIKDPALPAVSMVAQAVTNVTPPVTPAQREFAAAVRTAETTGRAGAPGNSIVAQGSGTGGLVSSVDRTGFQATADSIALSRGKPKAVTALPGTSASSPMSVPGTNGRREGLNVPCPTGQMQNPKGGGCMPIETGPAPRFGTRPPEFAPGASGGATLFSGGATSYRPPPPAAAPTTPVKIPVPLAPPKPGTTLPPPVASPTILGTGWLSSLNKAVASVAVAKPPTVSAAPPPAMAKPLKLPVGFRR